MTVTLGRNNSSKRIRKDKSKSLGEIFAFGLEILKFAMPLAILFCASVVKVVLTSRTDSMNKNADAMQKQIHEFDREIANYKVLNERFSGRSVLGQVMSFNLGLKYPEPGQVRKLENYPREPEIRVDTIKIMEDRRQVSAGRATM